MHRTVFYLFCARRDNPVFHALIEQAKPYPHYDLKNCLRFFADSKKNFESLPCATDLLPAEIEFSS